MQENNNNIIEGLNNNINKNIGGRKKSNVRQFYNINGDKLCCNMNDCKKTFSKKTSVATLKDHVYRYHEQNIYKKNSNENEQDNSMNNNSTSNSNIIMTPQELNERKLYKILALMFARNTLSHTLVEDTDFKKLIELIDNNIKITKCKLKESILNEGNTINDDILHMLSINEQAITLALDGWTNTRSNKVINILLICSGIAYYYTTIENENNLNNVAWLVPKLKEKIDLLIEKKLNIVAITTDNENLMKATCKKLKEAIPILNIVPCSAHLIQLCFKQICKVDSIQIILKEATTIINIIKNNKVNNLKLKNLQLDGGVNKPLKLINPIEIRWTSLIDSIERLLKLKDFIKSINVQITDNFWDNLRDLHLFLEPFKHSIEQIQKDNATLFSVWSNFQTINEFYKSNKVPEIFSAIAGNIIELINNKWNDHINNNLIEAVRLFNLEKNFQFKDTTINFIVDWGSSYLKKYNIIQDKYFDSIHDILLLQVSEFIARQNAFSLINSKDEQLKKICCEQKKQYSIKLLWSSYFSTYYELCNVVIAILSICPSEACVERSFSIQSNVHSDERNQLSNEIIEAEMNIKMNAKTNREINCA